MAKTTGIALDDQSFYLRAGIVKFRNTLYKVENNKNTFYFLLVEQNICSYCNRNQSNMCYCEIIWCVQH